MLRSTYVIVHGCDGSPENGDIGVDVNHML